MFVDKTLEHADTVVEQANALGTLFTRSEKDLTDDFGTEQQPNPEKNTQFHNLGHFREVAAETVNIVQHVLLPETSADDEIPNNEFIFLYSVGLATLKHDCVLVFNESSGLRARIAPERATSEYLSAAEIIGDFEKNGLLKINEHNDGLSANEINGIIGATVATFDIGFEGENPTRVILKIEQPLAYIALESLKEHPNYTQYLEGQNKIDAKKYLVMMAMQTEQDNARSPETIVEQTKALFASESSAKNAGIIEDYVSRGLTLIAGMSVEAKISAMAIANGDLRNAAGKMPSEKYLETTKALLREERVGFVKWANNFENEFPIASIEDKQFIMEEILGWYSVQPGHVKFQGQANERLQQLQAEILSENIEEDVRQKITTLKQTTETNTRYKNIKQTSELAEEFYQSLLEKYGAYAMYLNMEANNESKKIPSKFSAEKIEELKVKAQELGKAIKRDPTIETELMRNILKDTGFIKE